MNRKSRRRFLNAEWRKLAIANFAIDPAILHKFVPAGTELDQWHETYYVSLVGFMFLNTRLKGIRIPFHQNFEEVNLRFYVRYKFIQQGGEDINEASIEGDGKVISYTFVRVK